VSIRLRAQTVTSLSGDKLRQAAATPPIPPSPTTAIFRPVILISPLAEKGD
jgi:hypothetical protein